MSITPQWKDELRARVTLSSVIMRTTKLQRAGREWKACCPFHNEKTPSFTVNDQKGFYHCFGCGAHGDVISWMTDQRGLPFIEAIKELAAQAGMEVPAPDPVAAKRAEKRAGLVDVTEAAQKWFAANLHGPDGENAREYLRTRGFSRRIVEEFGFGYAPNNKIALKSALSYFDDAMLVESGMQISVEDKTPYDRFRDRLMLPIQDRRGRVIAFGGRILESRDGVAKYLNSPDTPLFDKGRTLYNLHRAGPASRQTNRLVVVEGYMDVIALANAGITDVVAPLGTALTENQLTLLWRLVHAPILCFDGDNAGRRAAMRAIGRALPMLQPGKTLSIVRLPAGLDPDDLIRKQGASALEKLLASPASLLDTLWIFERDAQDLSTPEDKAGLKSRLLEHVDTIQHADIRALYKRELLERFSNFAFPPRPKRDWKLGSRSTWQPNPHRSSDTASNLRHTLSGGARDEFTRAVIHGLLQHPSEIVRHTEALGKLAKNDAKMAETVESLLELSERLDSHGQVAISGARGLPAPPDNKRYAFLRESTDPVDAREELAEAVALLVERPELLSALEAAKAGFDEDPEGAFAEQTRLRERLATLNLRLKEFGRRKAGKPAETEISREGAEIEQLSDMKTD
ncbi:MAG: DNA primase [Proteobacteria bacterium]|nr:DNA primase [Pseudomonadota bacterium]MDA0914020.1 DNA primase [Pseudomonadota bacterium]MDA1033095.1 DNA primase [Pseudomonadota bacterium]